MRYTVSLIMTKVNSLTGRMIMSHISVAILTLLLYFFVTLVQPIQRSFDGYSLETYQTLTFYEGAQWLFGATTHDPYALPGAPVGFTLIVGSNGGVIYSAGDAPCDAGSQLIDCAPGLEDASESYFFEQDGARWAQIVHQTETGHRLISHQTHSNESSWQIDSFIGAILLGLSYGSFYALLLAIPLALLVVWLLLRPKIKRIEHIVNTSKRSADGELAARVSDPIHDDVGEWAARFDYMAETLAHNIVTLRDLARQNVELVQQVEHSAIQQERLRLSRDLHDSVAQRLFSLTVSTRSLPDVLREEPERGFIHARAVADLAQQTLLDLRALLIDLRPTDVIQLGLGQALCKLCNQVEATYNLPIDCSMMLFGGHIPAPVQDALYRIAQEALSNAAKHADASRVELSLVQGQQHISLSVTDDGTGMTTNAEKGGFGLQTMHERVLSLGGHFDIDSTHKQGTTVRVRLPLMKGEENGPDSDSAG